MGTASDFLVFLEAVRTDGRGVLRPETVRVMTENQLGTADAAELGEGVGFGFISSVVVDRARAKTAEHAGAFGWGGVYGHSWFVHRESRLSVVLIAGRATRR